jgi:hypothetical protein
MTEPHPFRDDKTLPISVGDTWQDAAAMWHNLCDWQGE